MTNKHLCRLCSAPLQDVFLDLGSSPLANSYLKPEALDRAEPFYPLTVYVCGACLLVQLPESESAEAIFGGEYLYFSSYSTSWLDHCAAYVDMMVSRFAIDGSKSVVELASNDGYLLQYFKQRGVPVLGVEPAANVAKVAIEERGIPTVVRFFGVETAKALVAEGKPADFMVANNVFAHVPNVHDFVEGIRLLLAPGGVMTFEFPHLMRLISEAQFDTIYHEHYSYLSLHTASRALREHALRVFDVEELPTHGGSLRLFVCHDADASKPTSERVTELVSREKAAGLHELNTYLRFRERVHAIKWDLVEFLLHAAREGKKVAAYGAAAKGNTLLNYCGVRPDLVAFAVDRSPHKQGHFLPGTRIPVYSPDRIRAEKPDYLLILAWNLKDEIMEQMAYVREWACKFVVSIPKIEVI
jgi:hypothetical protein